MGFWSNLLNKLKGTPTEGTSDSSTNSNNQTEVQKTKQTPQTASAITSQTEESHIDDEEEEDTSSHIDMDEYEKDDFGPYAHLAQNPNQTNFEEFWYQVFQIEEAGNQGEAAFAQALSKAGIQNEHHFRQIRETFTRHFSHILGFDQAMFNARSRQGKETMQAAAQANSTLLEPIDGVDIKTYATIQATIAKIAPQGAAAIGKLLAEHGLDDAKWKTVDSKWQDRMRQQDDVMASMALLSEYGKYFAAAGQGQYGAAAQAGAYAVDINGPVGQAPDASAAPCTLEKYAEIMAAQDAWHQQGRDVNAMLKQVFDMTALDFSNISTYWNAHIQSDYKKALELMDIKDQFMSKYKAGTTDADADLTV